MTQTLLAIETSQRKGSVALLTPGGDVVHRAMRDAQPVDTWLIPAIDAMMRDAELARPALDAVAISVGPGGFSGLRVGIATAKGITETLRIPAIPVPSALVAVEAIDVVGRIHVALACKRGSWWGTTLIAKSGDWMIETPPGLADATTLDASTLDAIVGDEHLPGEARELGVPVLPLHLDARRCLTVARRLNQADGTPDILQLAPIYPRPPEAVRKWAKRHNTDTKP